MPYEHGQGPRIPLWALPLLAGLLPIVAALTALWLSISLGLVPRCNPMPLLDGCVSISRAARHDLPNYIFRAIILPTAVLQALTWILCAAWLRQMETQTRTLLRVLPWLGILAGLVLIIYGTFLGTEGLMYRFLRRQGITNYFGFTYICMVIASGSLWRLAQAGLTALPARYAWILPAVCALTLMVGLTQAFGPLFLEREDLKDRLGNLMEWHAAFSFSLFFFGLAWLWKRAKFSAQLVRGDRS
jgi:hypothetical protein